MGAINNVNKGKTNLSLQTVIRYKALIHFGPATLSDRVRPGVNI